MLCRVEPVKVYAATARHAVQAAIGAVPHEL